MKVNRAKLAAALRVSYKGVAVREFVPSLMNFKFSDNAVTGFNGSLCVSMDLDFDGELLAPADLLQKIVNNYQSEELELKVDKSALIVSSGSSVSKVPSVSVDDYVNFETDEEACWSLNPEPIITAIEKCLSAASTDTTYPALNGVTLVDDEGELTAFASDNYTLARFRTGVKTPKGFLPTILPTDFCESILLVSKMGSGKQSISAMNSYLEYKLKGVGRIYSSMVELDGLPEFVAGMKAVLPKSKAVDLTDDIRSVIERATFLASPTEAAHFDVDIEGRKAVFKSRTSLGSISHKSKLSSKNHGDIMVTCDAVLLKKIMDSGSTIAFGDRAVAVFEGKTFTQITSLVA